MRHRVLALAAAIGLALVIVVAQNGTDHVSGEATEFARPNPDLSVGPTEASSKPPALTAPPVTNLPRDAIKAPPLKIIAASAVEVEHALKSHGLLDIDWDEKLLSASAEELRFLRDELTEVVSALTLPMLIAMVDAGMGELVSSSGPYVVRDDDYSEITYIAMIKGVGTIRAVLPREGNRDVYDLQDRRVLLGQVLRERLAGLANSAPR